MATCRL
ncbi:hypothetical protein R3I93_003362 [Phoxinus phoxinus]